MTVTVCGRVNHLGYVNSAFHPSIVGKSSTCLAGIKAGCVNNVSFADLDRIADFSADVSVCDVEAGKQHNSQMINVGDVCPDRPADQHVEEDER